MTAAANVCRRSLEDFFVSLGLARCDRVVVRFVVVFLLLVQRLADLFQVHQPCGVATKVLEWRERESGVTVCARAYKQRTVVPVQLDLYWHFDDWMINDLTRGGPRRPAETLDQVDF